VRSTAPSAARSTLLALLAVGLMNLPAMAASEKPLGTVVTTQDARLDSVTAAIGASVYSGDSIATDEGGSVRLALGATQMYLLSSSSAILTPQQNGVQATLEHGTLGFSTSTPSQFELETPFGIVRGTDEKQVFGEVILLRPSVMRVTSYEGTIVVEGRDGVEKKIEKGESYEVSTDPPNPADDNTPKVGVTGTRFYWKRVFFVAIPALIAGTGAAVAHHFLVVSQHIPTPKD
jgi:hypothetical protein